MAGINVWEPDGRYYCVRVWWPVLLCESLKPVLLCESLMAGINVRESDGRY